MRYASAPAALVLAVLATACGTASDPTAPSDAQSDAAAAVSAALQGPTWRLASIDGRPALPGVRVTAAFDTDERVTGSAGCNGYFGRAAVAGASIDVGLLASTRMFCGADGVMDQEAAYLAALQEAKAYRVAGDDLQLGPTSGTIRLVFRRE